MKNKALKITGILMAGGKSSRMGKEKGQLIVGDRKLYEYPLKVLEALCDEIIISSCNKDYLGEKYEQVCDEIPDIGPMGGLFTCLKKSSNDINIVLSYDLPLIKTELFEELLKSIMDFDIILPESGPGKIEPLCGIYKKHVYTTFGDLIEIGNYSVHKALDRVKSKSVLIDKKMPFYTPTLFLNVNSETDLNLLDSIIY